MSDRYILGSKWCVTYNTTICEICFINCEIVQPLNGYIVVLQASPIVSLTKIHSFPLEALFSIEAERDPTEMYKVKSDDKCPNATHHQHMNCIFLNGT